MINKKKTITIFAVLLTVLLIPSGIAAYAESDDTQTQQTSKMQNLKQAFDDIETSMIQNPMITSGLRSPVGPSPASSVNMVMINEDAGELWVGIDRSKYSGSLDSFESHLQNRYQNIPIRVEHADFEWNACSSLKSKTCNPQVAGMRYTVVTSIGGQTPSSLGLASEDKNGRKGVVITAHSVGHGITGTDIYSNVKRMTTAGIVQSFDIHHGQVIKNTAPDSSNIVPCDCAFVEFEKDSKGRYIETVEKNKIYKGRNAVYTVTGVHDPVGQESIKLVGQKANTVKDGHVLGTNLSFTIDKITVRGAFATTLLAGKGDSGGPIFTTPNSNDEVEIVGMISASTTFGGSHKLTAGIPWSTIMNNLDLKNP